MKKSYTPSIGELEAFAACARCGTTTRAAQTLNLTQSAVSRSIHALETKLGVNLFHRVRQRLVLSEAGQAMLRDTGAVLELLDRAAMNVMAFGGHSSVLRLAVLPTLASTWLVPKLGEFSTIWPDVTFDISARLLPVDFENEAFDGAIQRASVVPAGTISKKLMDETLLAVAAPSLVGEAPALSDTDLVQLPLLQQSSRPNLWPDWFLAGEVDARTFLRGARFEHFDMVIQAAIAGLGVALVPEILVQRQLSGGVLTLVSDRRLQGSAPYMLTYPARSEAREGFLSFCDWLCAQCALESQKQRKRPSLRWPVRQ